MNVYQKLQKCRVDLKKLPIKESGNNKFAGYTYMELGDFLPHIVDLCETNGLCSLVSFGETATLTIINSDMPEERIVFSSPMSTAELKGCHPIQNLGAVETYLRRYLYVAAFDIVEHDALDGTVGKEKTDNRPPSAPTQKPITTGQKNSDCISEAQRKMIFAKMKSMGMEPDELKAKFGVASSTEIKKSQMNDVLQWIDGKAAKE